MRLSHDAVQTRTLLENVTIAQSASKIIKVDLKDYSCAQNRFAIEVGGTSGTGNVDVTYKGAIVDETASYFEPTDTAILTDVGTTAKRTNVAPFTPTFCRFLEFTFTEDGTGDLVGVDATLIMQ